MLQKLQQTRPAQPTESSDVPRSFLGFCAWLGVGLTPGQAELARVSFDGVEPVDRGIATRIFGEKVPVGRRRVVCVVCGRRAGKSYVVVALRLLHGMLVRDVPALPPGTRAAAMVVAPRESMRMEVFRYARGAVESKPQLRSLVVHEKTDEFTLRRPDGVQVSFVLGPATAGGSAARGYWFTDFALDECAFFRDESFKVNDEEIFNAGSTVLLPGGQVIVASTPWAEAGLLYRLWKERPDNACVAHAPTLVMHDSDLTREIIAEAERQDADNAQREYGAVFMTGGTIVFFESTTLDAMLTDELFVTAPGDVIGAGGDFAFRGDSSALLMVAMRGDMLHLFDGTEERPEKGAPLKPSRTCARFAEVIARRCSYVTADRHHRESIEEHLEASGICYSPAPQLPADNYVRARQLLREGKVKVHVKNLSPELVKRLVQQLRETQGRPTPGGGMSITHPRWQKGGHGDLADAFTLAIWQVCGEPVAPPEPERGSREWEAMMREKRQRRMLEDTMGPSDRGRRAFWR